MNALRLIEALRSPSAYDHPVEEIQLLQTHISWVLLTGELAYKIKKPVDLGFVDFTTLARRKFYCEEELRLNRRLAPQLYLGVVPVTGTLETPRMNGSGDTIEYAVQMRQFLQEALLSQVLARRELTAAHIDALATQVADFHGRIAVAPANKPFGTFECLQHELDEVFEHLELNTKYNTPIKNLRTWCRQELAARKESLESRRRGGFVRECHGDMHLGNMLLFNGEPLIFDCLEFNEDFRNGDVLSEVAFTTMDLEDRGSPSLAHRYLNAYLEQTGDYSGLAVFRYYLVYRALVRAKVACLRLKQAGMAADEQRRIVTEYESYLTLAERFARPPHPRLTITHGPSGSGKTTQTQPLLETSGAIRIRSDVERKRLFGLNPLDRSDTRPGRDIYTAEATQRTYSRLAEATASVLRGGFSVIVDATFLKRHERAAFRRIAEELQVPFEILDFPASEETLRDRIVQRGQHADASEADLSVLASQLRSREPLEPDELPNVIPMKDRSG